VRLPGFRLPRLSLSLDRWDLFATLGIVAITGGIAAMHPPSAAIFLGLILAAIGFFGAPRSTD